jgi:uncharacterized protein YecE (DUF72 family)
LSEDELAKWVEQIRRNAGAGSAVYAYFNNDAEGYAVHDAQQLRDLEGDGMQPSAG